MAQISLKLISAWFFSGIDIFIYISFYAISHFFDNKIELINLTERKELTITICSLILFAFSVMYRLAMSDKLKIESEIKKEELKKLKLENEKSEIENEKLRKELNL